jgi:glyoxylase-like metal-dependent hydrolase (beta-lactamase superfamily II)
MALTELAPGLRRWTAWHDHWEEDVGSLALETGDGLLLIDPLEPPPALRRPEHVLLTVFWHGRSTDALGARHVWAPSRSATPLRNRGVAVTDPFRAGDELPAGIRAVQTARASEVAYWLPEQHAIAVGDVLLGAGAKPRPTAAPLRFCPDGWLGTRTHDDLRASLRPLLELPVARVLVSHGEPVLADGGRVLARLLQAPSAA